MHNKYNTKGPYAKIYNLWRSIHNKCYNIHSGQYRIFGANGITMDDEWKNSYPSFAAWFDSLGINLKDLGVGKLRLKRIDDSLGFTPNNCKFVAPGNTETKGSLYKLWIRIKSVCYNKTHQQYKNNGGRGITVYHLWKDNFTEFKNWFDSLGIEQFKLDNGYIHMIRINNDGDYVPNNCIFIPYKDSVKNKKLYHIWSGIIQKCYNRNHLNYKSYGGLGIEIYNDWKYDFLAFKKWWDTLGIPQSELGKLGLKLRRKNNNKNYTPDNCIFIPSSNLNENSKLYSIWSGIKTRCYNTSDIAYMNYGARGIKMCEPWKNNFMEFKKWFDTLGISQSELGIGKLSIDRKDPDGDYEPDNCRFTTPVVQSRNQRRIGVKNISGYRGISVRYNKYYMSINVNNKHTCGKKYNTKYQAMLEYDEYIRNNNLEHTKNNMILDTVYKLKPIAYVTIPYNFEDDYMLSGIYTRILNGLSIKGKLIDFINLHNLDISKITKTLERVINIINKTTNNLPVVVETAINNITVNTHKQCDDDITLID